jgi:hypothetical protein
MCNNILGFNEIQREYILQEEYNKVLELYNNSKPWKLVAQNKKKDFKVYQRKIEDHPLFAFKSVGKMPCSLNTLYNFFFLFF